VLGRRRTEVADLNRTAKYEEWDYLADRIHHRIDQKWIRRRQGQKV
jgi:hypothetical protein